MYLGRACRCTLVSDRITTDVGKKEDLMAIWEVIANWSVKTRSGRYEDFDTYMAVRKFKEDIKKAREGGNVCKT